MASDLLDSALRYAAHGWQVFPVYAPVNGRCSCPDAACESAGKHPRIAWGKGATTNPQKIAAWWKQWPDSNIGIATGARSRLVVIDVDGDEGRDTINRNGPLPIAPTVATCLGEHIYFAHPGRHVKNAVKQTGLDVRGDGGYVVAPPSLHASGVRYTWLNDVADEPALPAWLVALFVEPPEEPAAPVPTPLTIAQDRHAAYAQRALEGELTRLTQATEGARNDQLNRSAFALGTLVGAGWLDLAVAEHALQTCGQAIGLPRAEVKATVKSGLTAGQKEPRQALPERLQPATNGNGQHSPAEQAMRHWADDIVSLRKLEKKLFAALNWPVAEILTEGATLLAGKPKSKKSWLALGIGLAIARGTLAFNKLDVRKGTVLYLDLESNQRRMQSRVRAMSQAGQGAWPDNFYVANDWPRGPDAITRLEEWMVIHPETVLIVVDVFADLRAPKVKNADPYEQDRDAAKPLNQFAERHKLSMLIIHHTRKAKADDVFDEISGSTGLTGAVSNMWILGRTPSSEEYVLNLRGRDLRQEDPLGLQWNDYACHHEIVGSAAEFAMTAERRSVLHVLDDDKEHTARDIAQDLSKSVNSVTKLLVALVDDGLIEKSGYGKYQLLRQSGIERQQRQSGQSGQSLSTNSASDLSSLPLDDARGRVEAEFETEQIVHPDALNVSSPTPDSADSAYSAYPLREITNIPQVGGADQEHIALFYRFLQGAQWESARKHYDLVRNEVARAQMRWDLKTLGNSGGK